MRGRVRFKRVYRKPNHLRVPIGDWQFLYDYLNHKRCNACHACTSIFAYNADKDIVLCGCCLRTFSGICDGALYLLELEDK